MSVDTNPEDHVALHELDASGRVRTAGRWSQTSGSAGPTLQNAHAAVPVQWKADGSSPTDGALIRVVGTWDGRRLAVDGVLNVQPGTPEPVLPRRENAPSLDEVLRARASLHDTFRTYFEKRGFLEVETPRAVEAPGTDLFLEPVGTRSLEGRERRTVPPYLHTSPEFAMKGLLAEGFERIYQRTKVWRDGEITDLHHPEFSLLEWYRAWEPLDAIMADCERIVTEACDGVATVVQRTADGTESWSIDLEPPFERLTMRELVEEAAGFDLLEALEYETLRQCVEERGLLEGDLDRRHPPQKGRWDDLFFELMVTRLEPRLADRGAVFVTEWPAPLAVLARKSERDPRIAHRFELFVGGVELANGFDELTDADEQRRRFERELEQRRRRDMPELPMPEQFLEVLDRGLPRSSGVALGVDRLLMLALGTARIDDVAPFAHVPDLRDV